MESGGKIKMTIAPDVAQVSAMKIHFSTVKCVNLQRALLNEACLQVIYSITCLLVLCVCPYHRTQRK